MEYSHESTREDENGKYTTSITVQADKERFMASMQIHRERLLELYQDTQEEKGMDDDSNRSESTEFNHLKTLERHIQRLEKITEEKLHFDDMETFSRLLVSAIEAYDRLRG